MTAFACDTYVHYTFLNLSKRVTLLNFPLDHVPPLTYLFRSRSCIVLALIVSMISENHDLVCII
jgi:hypothetical protein